MSGFIAPGPGAASEPAPEDFGDLRAIPAPFGEVIGATLQDALQTNPTAGLFRWAERNEQDNLAEEQGRLLQPEDANRLFGIEGHLRFTEPLSEASAIQLRDLKRAELARQDVFARANSGVGGWSARLAVGLVGTAIDPLNIASAFVPVVGQTRTAAMLAQAGSRAGRMGVAARIGAVEGAAGAALIEPLNLLIASEEQRDYDMADSLLNVAFGAALGGLLQGGLRGAVDGWRGWRPDVPDAVIRETHEAAVRGATAQVVRGDPVNVEPVLYTAREHANAEVSLRAELMGGAAQMDLFDPAAPLRMDLPDGMAARMDEAPSVADMLDTLRAARPDDPEVQQLADDLRAADAGDAPAAMAEGQAVAQRIEEAWRALPPEARPAAAAQAAPGATAGPGQTAAAAQTPSAPSSPDPRATGAALQDAMRTERPASVRALAAAESARARQDGGTRVNTPAAKIEGEAADLDARMADTDAVLQQMVAAGRISEADLRGLDMAAAEERAQLRVKGIEAAAACLIANGA
jgi:hypothetical protein